MKFFLQSLGELAVLVLLMLIIIAFFQWLDPNCALAQMAH
jgi:hypothetical protein